MGLCPVRPRVDHSVDRPELYGPKGLLRLPVLTVDSLTTFIGYRFLPLREKSVDRNPVCPISNANLKSDIQESETIT
jgi:hypothetical protein